MTKITLTNSAYRALREVSEGWGFQMSPKAQHHLPDGRWEIAISDDVLDLLAQNLLPGETPSDAIERIIAQRVRGLN